MVIYGFFVTCETEQSKRQRVKQVKKLKVGDSSSRM